MSAIAATLCIFSSALCNVAVLDQKIFGNGSQVSNGGTEIVNIFGGIANSAGLGGLFSGGGQQTLQKAPRTPHQSPCAQKFQYVTDGREWKGIFKLKNVNLNRDTLLEADFVLPQGLNGNNYKGRIDLVNRGDSLYEDLSNGLPILFESVFSSQNPVPKLINIFKNDNEICRGPTEQAGLRTFRLKYLLKAQTTSLNGENELSNGGFTNQPVQPIQNPDPPRPTQIPNNVNQFQSDNSVCGVPVAGFIQSLVIGGQPAGRGEWPWLVALYRSSKGNLEFICGGSLISNKFTLTAAHCIQDKGRQSPMETKNALIFIGKHNLVEWNEDGFEKKGAKSFRVHPEWDPSDTKYDADIALIELDSPVKYSKFIRPICLWSGEKDISKVIGQNGTVVGWGKNEEGQLNTDFPKKINVPIVSDGQCLRAHEAFVYITSDRTFCAGGKMGEGPCQGDSGGGLVLRIDKKWFIRGIVSASLRDSNTCDVKNYAVFTDVAQFLPWIRNEMK